jgi:tRNA-2-methylthio-N6-dimethylallyladenosine synthase
MKYYSWTIGCQMNREESSALSHYLEILGLERVNSAGDADVVLLNTCVVRQNAEDKVIGMLGYLKGIKNARPKMRIAVTGCFVDSEIVRLKNQYPHVNFFFRPAESRTFEDWLLSEEISNMRKRPALDIATIARVSSFLTIMQGCNNYCSYCIVPYRRGRERSRYPDEIIDQALGLVKAGTREIVLLGQNVNAYGRDLDLKANLASLLCRLNGVKDLLRIRFLTNHPKDMDTELINAVASLEKVCHHICLPLQAGDDKILKAMNRHYTFDDYGALVGRIRHSIPDIALSTDIIVGFPGESEDQYQNTLKAVEDIGFDVVHVAAYSPRAGTAAERYADDIPQEAKMLRLHQIERLQTEIQLERNRKLVGQAMQVLVEGRKGGKWYGRTYSDKLVFFNHSSDCTGSLADITIESATPWALQGDVVS